MQKAIGGAITILLLVLYVAAVWKVCVDPCADPGEPTLTFLTLIGGLVSAAVIATLAVTPPATNPSVNFVAPNSRGEGMVTLLVVCYVIAWLGCGFALLWTWMNHPCASAALVAAAKSWLGLAVAAGYAYLGLKP